MKHRAAALLLMLWALLMGGCQKELAVEGPPLLIGFDDAHQIGRSIAWASHISVPPGQKIEFANIFDDILIVIESPQTMVTALSMRDGSILWRRVLGDNNDVFFSPVRSNDKLVINSSHELLILDIHDGQPLETQKLETIVASGPVVYEHFAIFGGTNGRVFAHNLNNGYSTWAYQLQGRILTRPVASPPYVFVADGSGVYAMFRALDGSLAWKGRTFARVSAQPTANRLGVIVASEDHSVYSLDRSDGRDRWVYRANAAITSDPISLGNNVYIDIPGKGLTAIDMIRGTELWNLQTDAEPVKVDGNRLLLNNKTSLLVVDTATGRQLLQVPVRPLQTVLPAGKDSLLLIAPNGRILRLN